jgi:predicted transcriptional regulator
MANPSSPILNKRTTLKDALSMMLDADVQTGIVVDRTGAVQGLLSVDTIADKMREGEHAAAFDQVPPPEPEVGDPEPVDDPGATPDAVEAGA